MKKAFVLMAAGAYALAVSSCLTAGGYWLTNQKNWEESKAGTEKTVSVTVAKEELEIARIQAKIAAQEEKKYKALAKAVDLKMSYLESLVKATELELQSAQHESEIALVRAKTENELARTAVETQYVQSEIPYRVRSQTESEIARAQVEKSEAEAKAATFRLPQAQLESNTLLNSQGNAKLRMRQVEGAPGVFEITNQSELGLTTLPPTIRIRGVGLVALRNDGLYYLLEEEE